MASDGEVYHLSEVRGNRDVGSRMKGQSRGVGPRVMSNDGVKTRFQSSRKGEHCGADRESSEETIEGDKMNSIKSSCDGLITGETDRPNVPPVESEEDKVRKIIERAIENVIERRDVHNNPRVLLTEAVPERMSKKKVVLPESESDSYEEINRENKAREISPKTRGPVVSNESDGEYPLSERSTHPPRRILPSKSKESVSQEHNYSRTHNGRSSPKSYENCDDNVVREIEYPSRPKRVVIHESENEYPLNDERCFLPSRGTHPSQSKGNSMYACKTLHGPKSDMRYDHYETHRSDHSSRSKRKPSGAPVSNTMIPSDTLESDVSVSPVSRRRAALKLSNPRSIYESDSDIQMVHMSRDERVASHKTWRNQRKRFERSSSDDSISRPVKNNPKSKTYNRKEVKLECYSGQSTETTIESYLAQFRLVAQRNQWPEDEWASELVMRLRGEARNLILPDESCKVPSFQKLCKRLKERFGIVDNPSLFVSQIRARRRKDKESIPELSQWIQTMGRKGYPGLSSETRDQVLLDFFVNSLPDENQRRYIMDREPMSMSEAAKVAVRYEGIQKAEDQRKVDKWDDKSKSRPAYIRTVNAEEKAKKRETKPTVYESEYERPIAREYESPVIRQVNAEKDFVSEIVKAVTASLKQVNVPDEPNSQSSNFNPQSGPMRRNINQSAPNNQYSGNCFNCGGRGHYVKDCKIPLKCHNCGRSGHMMRECRAPRRVNGHQGNGAGSSLVGGTAWPSRQ